MGTVPDPDDYVSLVDLRHRYCHYVDDAAYDDWVSLFTGDGTFVIDDGESYTGADELRAFCREDFDDLYDYQGHTVSNPVLETDGDEGAGRWYLFMPYVTPDGEPGLVQGRYEDEYRRVDGEWKLASVRVSVPYRELLGGD